MIGGFNIGSKDSPSETSRGILSTVKVVKSKFNPSTKIILLSIMPRNSKLLFKDINEVNGALNAESNNVGYTFVDLTSSFWDPMEMKVLDSMFENDKFIPSPAGLNAIKAKLEEVIPASLPTSDANVGSESGDSGASAPSSSRVESGADLGGASSKAALPIVQSPDAPVLSLDSDVPRRPRGIVMELANGSSDKKSNREVIEESLKAGAPPSEAPPGMDNIVNPGKPVADMVPGSKGELIALPANPDEMPAATENINNNSQQRQQEHSDFGHEHISQETHGELDETPPVSVRHGDGHTWQDQFFAFVDYAKKLVYPYVGIKEEIDHHEEIKNKLYHRDHSKHGDAKIPHNEVLHITAKPGETIKVFNAEEKRFISESFFWDVWMKHLAY